jgi:hypothetical protein
VEHLEHLEQTDSQVILEHQDLKDSQVLKGRRAVLEPLVQLAPQDL